MVKTMLRQDVFDSVSIRLQRCITLSEVLVKALGARARRFRQRRFSARFPQREVLPIALTLTAHAYCTRFRRTKRYRYECGRRTDSGKEADHPKSAQHQLHILLNASRVGCS